MSLLKLTVDLIPPDSAEKTVTEKGFQNPNVKS